MQKANHNLTTDNFSNASFSSTRTAHESFPPSIPGFTQLLNIQEVPSPVFGNENYYKQPFMISV
ncbi:hypothetical protein J6590_050769, partial [Homalodisca vitripennis]